MDQYDSSVKKSTQFQSSKEFIDNSVDIEGTNLMSTFHNKSLKKFALKSTTTRQFSTSKNCFIKYLSYQSINS